ncbi:selenoprotein O and cysteine-containing homologs [Nonlabens ulvanivorans]|nr:selenoprotein O and cysteine-containing homologs [Nonlabens ulvanivorans]
MMHDIHINNSFTDALPQDPITKNYTRQVTGAAYSLAQPLVFKNAQVIHVSELAQELGFTDDEVQSLAFKNIVTGQEFPDGVAPYAMAYAGHQFGNWAGQLGDGRAINLFEMVHHSQRWALQLKGAGPTPYSRSGDGLAVLRSSIREHLCSEAMHHLGIPTTRSLSLSLSGNQVLRDMLYDGNAAHEKGAIVCRVAPSFIRFGNFEWAAAQGNPEYLKQLTDYTIKTFYSHITTTGKEAYLQFFKEVTASTLDTIIHWQRVGFVHGVMNTDNMSILGLTIDYGPYGWLEPYDHGWTPNTTDRQNKRYRYGAQPEIGLWNLLQLANALYELINDGPALEAILNDYKANYQSQYLTMMQSKLGLQTSQENDQELIATLEHHLQLHETDMTLFFRELALIEPQMDADKAFVTISMAFYDLENISEPHQWSWLEWLERYLQRLQLEQDALGMDGIAFAKAKQQQMNAINPKYVLRNYIAQLVIDDADKGDYTLLNEVYRMLQRPYDEQPEFDKWYDLRPDWARNKVGCSMLSCSS